MADLNIVSRCPPYSACERHYVTLKLSATGVERLKEMLKKKKERSFPSFTKLPPELRVMIWRLAVYRQDRLVEIEIPHTLQDEDGWEPDEGWIRIAHAPVPPLFLVNKEAYYETKLFYGLYRCSIDTEGSSGSLGPRISFENDIFFYTGIAGISTIASTDMPWTGYKPITEVVPSRRQTVSEKCLRILPLRGCRRFAITKEHPLTSPNLLCCHRLHFSLLTAIDMVAYVMKVDELRVISREGNQIIFTRRDWGPDDTRLQHIIRKRERAERTLKKFNAACRRFPAPSWTEIMRIDELRVQWNHGILQQDMRHDDDWYRCRVTETEMSYLQIPYHYALYPDSMKSMGSGRSDRRFGYREV
ncbi:hypothetical protein ANO14919_027490 [Xylariales sp. No.14919]|nr:hypothetical protein ANO14919_027490 [Xylariales sp. No.14919]